MVDFFSWKKFECGKNLRVSLFPYPKEAPECPLYRAESKKISGLLHLGHTFRTYIQNYIQKLHFNPHQNYIRITLELLSAHPLLVSMPIIITFRNYIPTYIRITLDLPTRSFACLLHHLLYAHPQTFYHIIITFRIHIQNYILTYIIIIL